MLGVVLSLLLVVLPMADAMQAYQQQIPNGAKVPHPCDTTTTWPGVGHRNPGGGMMPNQFGSDFSNNNHLWNSAICQMDSDGDGKSNGAELGDPNCAWTQGATPAVTSSSQLSHPGVCEPITASKCASYNDFLTGIDICVAKLNTTTTSATTAAGATTTKAASLAASSTQAAAATQSASTKNAAVSYFTMKGYLMTIVMTMGSIIIFSQPFY